METGQPLRAAAALLLCAALAGCGSSTDEATDRAAATDSAHATAAASPPAPAGLPAQQTTGPVYGNPDDASAYWVEQSYSDCGLIAVATIVGMVTGNAPSEQDIIELASHTPSQERSGPIYLPPQPGDDTTDNATAPEDQLRLLKHFGIAATITNDDIASTGGIPTGRDALQQYLGAGRKAIVGVNAETIWGEDGNHTEEDHAVVVAAIDADQQVVYLSDSGTESGAGEQVPLDTFETAWRTGGHALLVTNDPS
ncbi:MULTISPECIES: hypothetical protein [unclassified Mycolicibacterium]|uniref:hypothetical protein n=1 Tax=unclassified Mycolicibacterium TaxID=2636767 RepID=UPI0012DEE59E|nr:MULTISPECIES: hypothetical protein [unclassified Mycolicibacterium]MUL80700.1 hypothetical protein [Mycolicibacterium sp. CBMA 329]MUL86467.1 hypothetical protein [Mycolicibacterium sp. CBMA 331]MUM01329.1 hypothetical protein [Mycolicibacterium sp. CBMA 334]MUM25839.1 hypothetical protein [Mycolicibacterium sp. CBMA 295]MUM36763.1 hypothetical protein [Mycolicibacterium sp. CBMA 247]